MCDEFEEVGARIVQALIDAPLAWLTLEQLSCRLSLSLDEINDALAELDAEGMLATWEECPKGLAVTFTPLGAYRLKIKICEVGPFEIQQWFSIGMPDPYPPPAKRVFRDPEKLGLVVDPSPGPVELAEIAEEEPSRKRLKRIREGAWGEWRKAALRAERKREKKARQLRKAKRRARGNARPATCASP
jgi:hypothetical protein